MHAGEVVPYTIASGVVGPQAKATALGEAGVDQHYWGFSLCETAGATAKIRIHDGGVVGGKIIEVVAFSANQSVREGPFPVPVVVVGGIYVELVSGTLPEGTIRLT